MPKIPEGQRWLISRLQSLGYTPNEKGVCYAVSHTSMHAFFAKDIKTYNNRLLLLNSISPSQLANDIKKVETKIVNLRAEKSEIEDVEALLTEEERLLISTPAFFDEIMVYQSPELYPDVFPNKKSIEEQRELSAELVIPIELEKQQEKIEAVDSFKNAYDLQGLKDYFHNLATALADYKEPIGLVLSSSEHGINVNYDPVEKMWTFTDANGLPIQFFSSIDELAPKVLGGLSKNNATIMQTQIFTLTSYKENLTQAIESWVDIGKNNVSPRQAQLQDSLGETLLKQAVHAQDIGRVKELLSLGADPNITDSHGRSLLYMQILAGNKEMVEVLLSAENINPDLPDVEGKTPLSMAVLLQNTEMVKMLIEKGASAARKDFTQNTTTPFYQAILKKNETIIALFLEAENMNPYEKNILGVSLVDEVMAMDKDQVTTFIREHFISTSLPVKSIASEICQMIDEEIARLPQTPLGQKQAGAWEEFKSSINEDANQDRFIIDIYQDWKNQPSPTGEKNIDILHPGEYKASQHQFFGENKTDTFQFLEVILEKYAEKKPASYPTISKDFEKAFLENFASRVCESPANRKKFITQWSDKALTPLLRVHKGRNAAILNDCLEDTLSQCKQISDKALEGGLKRSPIFPFIEEKIASRPSTPKIKRR